MINRTGLRDLFDDPKQAADIMGRCFYRLMENKIAGDWERHLDEECANEAGYESFIAYACGGLTYEQFIGDPAHVWMDLERLNSFIFFLESLGATYPDHQQLAAQHLGSLMRMIYGRRDVLSATINDLEACLTELKKLEPDTARVRKLANSACLSLRSLWDQWYLIRLCSILQFSSLLREVCGRSKERKRGFAISLAKARNIMEMLRHAENAGNAAGQYLNADKLRKALDEASKSLDSRDLNVASKLPIAKIRKTLKLMRRADMTGRAKGESLDVDQLRHLLDDLRQGLKDPDLNAAAKVPARYFDGMISDEMKRVADGLEKGLRMKSPAKRHLKEGLNKLLSDLRPYSGERKCRPYELLLFAAQKRLRQEKLVRKRSLLASNFIPNPPNAVTSLSILETHRGADLAMGIGDSE